MDSADAKLSDESFRIAYLRRRDFEEARATRCGALVVDAHGFPLEFRATSPSRPNPLQRTMYGQRLEPYMLVEVLGKPLLKELREAFHLVIVGEHMLLDLRQWCDKPVIYLRRQGAEIAVAPSVPLSSRLLNSACDRFSPVVYETYGGFEADLDAALPMLETAALYMDPLEPLERVAIALDQVHQAKELDSQK